MTSVGRGIQIGATMVWIAACIVLGGSSVGFAWGNGALQFAAVAGILTACWGLRARPFSRDEFPLLALFGLLSIWLILTAIPLPPRIWILLPGRASVAEGYRLLGMPLPWLPIALDPERLPRSALGLLPLLCTFLLVRALDDLGRRMAILALLAIVSVSFVLGALQVGGGPDSPLRFYAFTNRNGPVGFFANSNHLAGLLLIALPFTAGVLHRKTRGPKTTDWRSLVTFGVIAFLLSLGIASVRSLAGIVLLVPALIGSISVYVTNNAAALRGRRLAVVAVCGVMLPLAATALLSTPVIQGKFSESPGSRGVATPTTIAAAMDFMPTGSGLGSFVQVYGSYEPPALVTSTWMNHAHDDYAEVALELGVPGVLLMVGFLLWFLRRSYIVWTDERRSNSYARAATIAVVLLLAHSAVDYPLRTSAMAAVFAMSCVFLLRSWPSGGQMLRRA